MPAERFTTGSDEERAAAVDAAARAVTRGELVVIPTDTVYGIGADAFDPVAVKALLDAKGRGREMPPPVLVASATTLDALAVGVPEWARALTEAFWPGALTLVCHQQSSLQWDLGETRGTVAVRVPDHPVAIEVLERTGPLAVSSANRTGMPAATDADAAEEMLGHAVAVLVDSGPTSGPEPSTIVDATGEAPRLLRLGAIGVDRLNEVLAPHDVTVSEGE
ncbi:L-threonylcarbamoyladenylate synthase [Nocardioides sp. CER19]|nr:L-threonylcarbamoyladenylate synthase [Nocardioides sp. CER19]MDH2415371.1 L-threonylcarbamoyladenylate synthase [Nocardioides sp. CER19]